MARRHARRGAGQPVGGPPAPVRERMVELDREILLETRLPARARADQPAEDRIVEEGGAERDLQRSRLAWLRDTHGRREGLGRQLSVRLDVLRGLPTASHAARYIGCLYRCLIIGDGRPSPVRGGYRPGGGCGRSGAGSIAKAVVM